MLPPPFVLGRLGARALSIAVMATIALPVHADAAKSDEVATQEALKQTQEMLRNPHSRDAAIKASPDAQKSNQQVESVAGSKDNADAIYNISADIFAEMVKQSQGDPAALQRQLELAQKNPEAFFNSLPAAQRDKLKGLAGKIESARTPSSGKP